MIARPNDVVLTVNKKLFTNETLSGSHISLLMVCKTHKKLLEPDGNHCILISDINSKLDVNGKIENFYEPMSHSISLLSFYNDEHSYVFNYTKCNKISPHNFSIEFLNQLIESTNIDFIKNMLKLFQTNINKYPL